MRLIEGDTRSVEYSSYELTCEHTRMLVFLNMRCPVWITFILSLGGLQHWSVFIPKYVHVWTMLTHQKRGHCFFRLIKDTSKGTLMGTQTGNPKNIAGI